MSTEKKITRVDGGRPSSTKSNEKSKTAQERTIKEFAPTPESKKRATTLRIVTGILWALAIGAQIFAISLLFQTPIKMTWIIVLIVIDLILVISGALLWKKSNRLDPASEKDKTRFFIQSQLGMIAAVVAFLPLIIFILGNKNIDGKQKGILTAVAGGALIIGGLVGFDFNPPSIEQYTEETNRVEWLNEGRDDVYWTKAGTVYHLYSDCSYINTAKTDEIFEGSVAQARELKNISRLCNRCEKRAISERDLKEDDYTPAAELLESIGGE